MLLDGPMIYDSTNYVKLAKMPEKWQPILSRQKSCRAIGAQSKDVTTAWILSTWALTCHCNTARTPIIRLMTDQNAAFIKKEQAHKFH